MAMDIYPDYIDAAHEMYDRYKVDADVRAVDTLEYSDPTTGRNIVLEVYWRMSVNASGPTEVWSVILPRQGNEQVAFKETDESSATAEIAGIELGNDSKTKWNIYFQARNGIIVSAKTRKDLFDAVADCRECLAHIIGLIPQAA